CITIAVAFAIMGVCTWYGANPPKIVCGFVGACLALIAGVGKEASDYITNRKFDFSDLLADVVGAAIGIVLILLS
ncbi:MAG: hypothetical protein II453_12725, partial [Alphaproteobacteria bacterium]|nr:hypothetical protein [Alphaproteobacteria bacterium]